KVLGTLGASDDGNFSSPPHISPDGHRVALIHGPQSKADIWLLDVPDGFAHRFTYDGSVDGEPVWSTDGNQIAFRRSGDVKTRLYVKPSDGSRSETPLLDAETWLCVPLDWSPDKLFLICQDVASETGRDLWLVPTEAGSRPRAF